MLFVQQTSSLFRTCRNEVFYIIILKKKDWQILFWNKKKTLQGDGVDNEGKHLKRKLKKIEKCLLNNLTT